MGVSIYLFATHRDCERLSTVIHEMGMYILPILMEQEEIDPSDDPSKRPYCYVTRVPRERLHPYGDPPGIGPATDPLIGFMRPYENDSGMLIVGRLYCSDDVPELFADTLPLFRKLRRWIQKNWHWLPEGQYAGPEAFVRIQNGAKRAYFPEMKKDID